MRILPDGTVEIKNKNTKETKIVNPADLPNYGISYTTYKSELESAKQVGIPTTAEITVKSSNDLQKEKETQKYKQDVVDIATQLQNTINNKNKYSPEQYKQIIDSYTSALTTKQKEAAGFGASLTGNELAILAGQIPVRQEIGPSIGSKINQAFTGKVPPQTGRVVDTDEQILRKLSILVPQLQGKEVNPETFLQNEKPIQNNLQEKSLNGLLGNAGNDMGSLIKSIPDLMRFGYELTPLAQSVNQLQGKPTKQLETILEAGKGIANEYNNVLGKPLEGGDVMGRIGENAYQHPVNTALDILPFLGGASKLTKSGKLGDVVKAGEVGSNLEKPNVLQDIIRSTADTTSGGGSKEYIARIAKEGSKAKEVVPQNQVLMEENILAHPTETGKITATSKSMEKYGSELENIYTKSKEQIKGSDIGKLLDERLKERGYDSKAIDYIKSYINDYGGFDLKSGEALIPQVKIWRSAQNLEKNPPKMMNNPESAVAYKQLSKDAAGIIREVLADKNPDVLPINARYSALADYMNNVLSNPQGIAVKGGIMNTGAKAVKSVSDVLLNALYQGSNPSRLLRDMRYKQGNFNFKNE